MRNYDFIKNRKIAYIISAAILLIGLVVNLIFGTVMDISFTGGTELPYSYTGELTQDEVASVVLKELPEATVTVHDGSIMITLTDAVDNETIAAVEDSLQKQFKDNKITLAGESRSLQAAYGRTFFIKCLVAVALASILVVLFVGFRFRTIDGTAAAVVSLGALLHDVLIAYFVFVIFRIPLNDNFVAVILTILGYSLNDTIVVFDRIRENRRKMDSKAPITEIVNVSLRQSFTRTLNTSICTLLAIGTVAVVALVTSMESIVSFALPMSIGVVAGFFSSTFLCTPVWALWVEASAARKKAKKPAKKGRK